MSRNGNAQFNERNPDYHKSYYQANKAKVLARQREYRQTTKGKAVARAADLKHKYAITPEEYTAQFIAQDGTCAVCHQPSELRLHVDHDHATGKVRGLLCSNCNTAIGLLQDNPHLMARAADYLKESPWT